MEKETEEKLKDFDKLLSEKEARLEKPKRTPVMSYGPWWPDETFARKRPLLALIIVIFSFIIVALSIAIFNWKY